MSKVPGIYVISDMNNGKSYIGSTIDLDLRHKQHLKDLKSNKHFNPFLQNCFNKGHEFRIIKLPSEKPEDVLQMEQQLLDEFIDKDTLFNISRSSTAPMLGRKQTPETIEKIRQTHIGIPLTEEHKELLSEIAKAQGRTPSQEALAKSIEVNKNRIRTSEELKKISDSSRERMKDPKVREHLSKINFGIKHTPEDILKMKEIGKNNTFSDKANEARLKATIGRIQSQEEKDKRILSITGLKREGKALENIQNAGLMKSKPVIINGINYRSTKIAAEILNINPANITKRINKKDDKYKNWKYDI